MSRPRPPRIALATAQHLPDLTPEDRLLQAALRARGVDADPLVWSDFHDAPRPDAVLIRSCWDYHLRVEEFFHWLEGLERAGVLLLNPLSLLRWNAHKRYLDELATAAAAPPRVWFSRGCREPEHNIPPEWGRVVIKPAVSASAYETWVADLPLGDAERMRLRTSCAGGDVMAQRYVREIETAGEVSFVFIAGQYSHAVRKHSAPGDFRVQVEFGGRVRAEAAGAREIGLAAAVLAAAPEVPLYARVDAVVTRAAFHLMELELIDPQLFFLEASQPLDRLVEATLARLRATREA